MGRPWWYEETRPERRRRRLRLVAIATAAVLVVAGALLWPTIRDLLGDLDRSATYPPPGSSQSDPEVLLALINDVRADAGLGALELDTALSLLAEKHSRDMQAAGELLRVPARDLAAFDWRKVAQLVAHYSGDFPTTPQDIYEGFVTRERYRRDLEGRTFDRAGIGLVREGNDLWVTVILIAFG